MQKRASTTIRKTRTAADDYAQQVRDNPETQTKVISASDHALKQFGNRIMCTTSTISSCQFRQPGVSDTNNYDQTSGQQRLETHSQSDIMKNDCKTASTARAAVFACIAIATTRLTSSPRCGALLRIADGRTTYA